MVFVGACLDKNAENCLLHDERVLFSTPCVYAVVDPRAQEFCVHEYD